jgi:hypothetical protein
MEADVYEVQEEDLVQRNYRCDEDDLTKTCIRDLAGGDKKPPSVTIPTSTHSSRHRSSSDLWSAAAWPRLPNHLRSQNLLDTNSRAVI